MKTFYHLGGTDPDYRGIMQRHGDFELGSRLIPASRVVIAEQTHSDLVHVCGEDDCGAGFGDHPQIAVADGLVTDIPGQYLLIRTADCYPVLFYDRLNRAVGAVHSGREGTRKNIAGGAVALLGSRYGIEPEDLYAWIGPGICADHYEVSEDIWDRFNQSLLDAGTHAEPYRPFRLDLRLTVFRQLLAAGLPFRNIDQQRVCTLESATHFSYRRDGTRNRQINLIGLEP